MSTNLVSSYAGLDNDVVLRVDNLYKKFCRTLKYSMYYGAVDSVRSMLGVAYATDCLRKNEFWALQDVSFELHRGEALGIIGINGSGKSTLLRLISGIFPPDKGRIAFQGRIGALIAVGAGFHPHMTGLENIYLNGTILGMRRSEIDAQLQDIIEFADIGDFLDAPISTYSSGMRVRLGFAISIHCQPDILLVDEVLSVGDLAFRNKAMRRMHELRATGQSLVFISHNLDQIRVLCDRVILLDHGSIMYDGDAPAGIIRYENMSKKIRAKAHKDRGQEGLFRKLDADGSRIVSRDLGLLNTSGNKIQGVEVGDELIIYIDFTVHEPCEEVYFALSVQDEKKSTDCLWVKSNDSGMYSFNDIEPGTYRATVTFKEHHLGPGVYFLNYAIRNGKTGEVFEHGFTDVSFWVTSGRHYERGIVLAEDEWSLIRQRPGGGRENTI